MTVSHQIILAGLTASALAVYCLHSLLQRHEKRVQEELTEWPRPTVGPGGLRAGYWQGAAQTTQQASQNLRREIRAAGLSDGGA